MSDITEQLEAERRIINAATPGPWIAEWHGDDWWFSIYGAAAGEDVLPEVATLDDRESKADAAFIAHARTALPLRNAQLSAVLAAVSDAEAYVQAMQRTGGRNDYMDGLTEMNRTIRTAIEEAGR